MPDLFYMEDAWQKESSTGKLSSTSMINLLKHLIKHDPFHLFNPLALHKHINRISNIYGSLPDWRDPYAKFFHTNEYAYFKYLTQFENGKINLNQNMYMSPSITNLRCRHLHWVENTAIRRF